MSDTTSGSCVCKKVTYEYTGQPAMKAMCHCLQCQKLTGSAFTYNLLVPRENFKWTGAAAKGSSFTQEIGLEVSYSFCPDCGTTLSKEAHADAFAPFILVQAGTVDAPGAVKDKPDAELWTSRRVEWLVPIEGVAQKAQF